MEILYVHSMFVSSFTCPPVRGVQMQKNFKYVNNIHNFILFTINCVFYDDFIYLHTAHILISFFKDRTHMGKAPTKGPRMSNLRGNDRIFTLEGHISKRRIP
jgi:hypothetical protein